MCMKHLSFRCCRCDRGVPSQQVENLIRTRGMSEDEMEQHNLRFMCDECSLAAHRRGRWWEKVLLGLLLVGIVALVVGRVLG